MTVVSNPSRTVSVLRLLIGGLSAVAIAPIIPHPALAQLAPDSTLGSESSVVVPDSTVNGEPAIQIEGGAARGESLFHSFDQFNVDAGQRVYFANPAGVSTIFNRVTGDSPSDISGTLGVNGGADLFFINPNGIFFGPNGMLDVSGSVVFSTAESVLFNDGVVFSTVSPQAPPLLTVSAPVGLQYGSNPAGIRIQGDGHRFSIDESSGVVRVVRDERPPGLQVPSNRTLALVGGNLDLAGGNVTVESGRLELGSVGAGSRVALSPVRSGWALSYTGVENFQNIRLTQAALADASGTSDIQMVGREILLTEGSAIVAETLGAESGGLFNVQASELVRLTGTTANTNGSNPLFFSGLYAQSGPTSTSDAGNLTIVTQRLQVEDGAQVNASNFGTGRGRNLIVEASDSVELTDQLDDGRSSVLFTETAGGDAGDLVVTTRELSVLDRAVISSSTYGPGRGGNLTINASDAVIVSGPASNIATTSGPRSFAFTNNTEEGDSGDLEITTSRLRIQENAFISSGSIWGSGAGGDLTINASESVQLSNSGELFSSVNRFTVKEAGNLTITTGRLDLQTGGSVFASTFGNGSGGTVNINAEQVHLHSGGRISAETRGSGDAGNVNIQAQRIQLQEKASIEASTEGRGAGGTIAIIDAEQVDLQSGGRISAETQGSGDAGNVNIQAQRIQLQEDASIEASTEGSGVGGTIQITGAEQVILQSGGRISASTGDSDEGGYVTDVQAQEVQFQESAFISASTDDSGRGGNIYIQAHEIQLQEGASITTDAHGSGPGGNVNIQAQKIQLQQDALISADAYGSGAGGNVNIQAQKIQLQQDAFISTDAFGSGAGGNVELQAQEIQLQEEAFIATDAYGSGAGGNVEIQAQEIQLQDFAFISADAFDSGAGGNIDITAMSQLTVTDGAKITVNSTETGLAGNMHLSSNFILLDNGEITAETNSGDGGNITLQADNILLLRNGSLISTEAGNAMAGGDGGDISVDAGFIVAVSEEDSDISANAFEGMGGNISIRAQGILGIEVRENRTPLSDITASSELGQNGLVILDTPKTATNADVVELRADLIDASEQIEQSLCAGAGNEFIASGRGGLPTSPNGPLNGQVAWEDWYISEPPGTPSPFNAVVAANTSEQTSLDSASATATSWQRPSILEAQGWIRDSQGNVLLTASALRVSADGLSEGVSCQQLRESL